MDVTLSPGAFINLGDEQGRRTLPDDPGFACTLTRGATLLCLRIPTDQDSQSVFKVSVAKPVGSDDECFKDSEPHF